MALQKEVAASKHRLLLGSCCPCWRMEHDSSFAVANGRLGAMVRSNYSGFNLWAPDPSAAMISPAIPLDRNNGLVLLVSHAAAAAAERTRERCAKIMRQVS